MKKTFRFTEEEVGRIVPIFNGNHRAFDVLDRIEQIVSERITPEAGESVKPVPSIPIVGGGSVASDRTEQCESAKEFLSKTTASGVIERKGVGEYSMSFDIDKLASILTTYASQVCADKDREIDARVEHWDKYYKSCLSMCSRLTDENKHLKSELDRLNESLTVIVRKNAELEKEVKEAYDKGVSVGRRDI